MEFTSYRYRIYPNREQREFFELNFYCCTLVWNLMREDKARHYLESGKILQTTPAQYKKKYPVLSRADSMALCNVQQNLQNAYNRFFSNVENQIRGGIQGKNTGPFPGGNLILPAVSEGKTMQIFGSGREASGCRSAGM
ncbi:MAG: helix-turn-helix domain-containing protein [Clostridiales bacterium]|nr:helix-turn-helix domain-containing protein [Clostridiales bacterium]